MKKIILILFILIIANRVSACSSFFFNSDSRIFAKNFDWSFGEGYILKNQRNQKKFAYGFRNSNVASWTSKFGSITFNQNGKEFPYGGINEKGLVIEQLWLSSSQYQDNKNQEISELEWIQYQLDNYQSVEEIVENINSLTIKPIASIHYMIADKNGNSAVIEFLNGKVKIDKQNSKFQAITNESSEDSKKYSKLNKIINSDSRTHFDRYCILENQLASANQLNINSAFDFLNSVKVSEPNYKSFWSIVYDLEKGEIYFQSVANPNIKSIKMADFDFNTFTEFSEINSDTICFKSYTSEDNFRLLAPSLQMMNLDIDNHLANEHQMKPDIIVEDKIFQTNYFDLTIEFSTRKSIGNIYYMFTKGNMNDGFSHGILPITEKNTKKIIYHFPKGEFALKCFLDSNFDGKIDKNIIGIPIRTGFSNNKKKIFGIPPNYKTAKVNLNESKILKIKI